MKRYLITLVAVFAAMGTGKAYALQCTDYTSCAAVVADSANDSNLATMVLKWPSAESGLQGLGIGTPAYEGTIAVQEAAAITPTMTAGAAIPVITTGATAYLVTRELLHLTGGDQYLYRLWGGTPSTSVTAGSKAPYKWTFNGGCCSFGDGIFGNTNDLILTGNGTTYYSGGDTSFDAAGAGAPVKVSCCGGLQWSYLSGRGATSRAASLRVLASLGLIQGNTGQASDYSAPGNSSMDLGGRPSTCTGTCLSTVRSTLANGTAASQAATIAIGKALDNFSPQFEIGFLDPLPNEDYPTYVARLRADGWLGTVASVTTETSTLPGYGPNAITRVLYTPSGQTQRVYDPLAWPSPAPTIDPNQALEFRINPSTATPAPTTGSSSQNCGAAVGSPCYTVDATPDPTTGETYTGPTVPSAQIDWSPLESIAATDKFPFGAYDFMQSALGWFNVTPTCPSFDINVPGVTGAHPISSPGHYSGNLCFADTYMSWVRTMISVALWIGAIWFVAVKLLHWDWGGDLSDAADDGSVFE